ANTNGEAVTDRADPAARDPLLDLTVRELYQALAEEVDRLPERFRAPLVLCYLEGRTQAEAARRLGWGAAPLRGPLHRGRAGAGLRGRLTRRGLAVPAGLLAFGLTPAAPAVPPALAAATLRAGVQFAAGAPITAATVCAAALAAAWVRAATCARWATRVLIV